MSPTLARTWRGTTRAEDADAYLAYLRRTGLAEYARTPGNRGVLALRRTVGDETEWLLVTLWDSPAAVRRFAADPDDPTRAVFYPDDDRFLLGRDARATHFEVVHLETARLETARLETARLETAPLDGARPEGGR